MKWVLATLIFLTLASSAPGLAADVSPAGIEARIGRDGAQAEVNRLKEGAGALWQQVLARIASGNSAWLDVARDLRPGVDASTGEDLGDALALALPRNASGVLRLAAEGFPLAELCGVPFIEPTDTQVARWKGAALSALAKVNDPALADRLAECRSDVSADK
jgi:hypothetical protein